MIPPADALARPDREGPPGLRQAAPWLVAAALLASVFNLRKAQHVDDPLVLDAVAAILRDPLRPYSGITHQFTRPLPLWSNETNPPFLSYVLSPVAALSSSELAVHLVMAGFVVLLAFSLFVLARRFGVSPIALVALGLGNVGVLATTNLMRDVPAAALIAASVACFTRGVDRGSASRLVVGAALAGLACVTKYSAVVLLPLLAAYALLHRSPRSAAFLGIGLVPFGLWSAQNLHVHGALHVLEISRRSYGALQAWRDNLCGLPGTYGALLYLAPLVLLALGLQRRVAVLLGVALCTALGGLAMHAYLGKAADPQVFLFAFLGGALLSAVLLATAPAWLRLARGATDPRARDDVFLGLWVASFAVFSVLFPPFQAVRHALPALPAVALLALRIVAPGGAGRAVVRAALFATIVAQIGIAALVAITDTRFAEVYRDAPTAVAALPNATRGTTWFVGNWSFAEYARRAGFRPLDPAGEQPRSGDRIVWPREVNQSPTYERHYRPAHRWRKIASLPYESALPFRTIHRSGAHLYALQSRASQAGDAPAPVPYRFLPGTPLEVVDVYEVP